MVLSKRKEKELFRPKINNNSKYERDVKIQSVAHFKQ